MAASKVYVYINCTGRGPFLVPVHRYRGQRRSPRHMGHCHPYRSGLDRRVLGHSGGAGLGERLKLEGKKMERETSAAAIHIHGDKESGARKEGGEKWRAEKKRRVEERHIHTE